MRKLTLLATLAVMVSACGPTSPQPEDHEWVTVLADLTLSHLGADYDGRPAVVTDVSPGLEHLADALARVPGAVDAADRPRRVPMTPEALASLREWEASHPPRPMRDAIPMRPASVDLILGWAARAEEEGLLESAEADRQRSRLIGPVDPRATLLNIASGSWKLTLLEIVTDEAGHKEANFLFAEVREVERDGPKPRISSTHRVNGHGIEAFWQDGAWVPGEIGRRRGTTPTVVIRGAPGTR